MAKTRASPRATSTYFHEAADGVRRKLRCSTSFGLACLLSASSSGWKAAAAEGVQGSYPLIPNGMEAVEEAFVVGDLHADLHCARHWVKRSGMVDLDATPYRWIGRENQALIFLGDYVDKGSEGRAVLTFVKSLTEAFPDRVAALLGNHDLYMLFDALFKDGASQLMGIPVRYFSYAFTHPEEYLNWINTTDQEKESVLTPLFQALDFVYQRHAEGKVLLSSFGHTVDLFSSVPPFSNDPALATKTKETLEDWHYQLSKGLIDTGLAQWLASRPLFATVGGALLLHGGLPPKLVRSLGEAKQGIGHGLNRVSESLRDALLKATAPRSLEGDLTRLLGDPLYSELVHEGVTYRGLHKKCSEVQDILNLMKSEISLDLIVLGHTPGDELRSTCQSRLVASDSSLSRSFRAHGNLYCPTAGAPWAALQGECASQPVHSQCEGQAGRLRRSATGRWQMEAVNPQADPKKDEL